MYKTIACWTVIAFGLLGHQASAQSAAPAALDYEFFKARVQPVFLAKRPGHARCVSCHGAGARLHPALVPLAKGANVWNDEDSRKNFAEFSRFAVPGSARSPLLRHPLAEAAGGDAAHGGGKHFSSQNDPEWLTLKAWVMGSKVTPSPAASKARILQTNSAGDNIHVIDPATNEVVGQITGIEVNHGVAVAPDGSRLYVTSESESSLYVVDGKTYQILKRIKLSGVPNNLSISHDGRRVYVAIRRAPGGVDVIDTVALTNAKTIPTGMTVHNTFVTPDGKYVLAGSVEGSSVGVIDAKTEKLAWSIPMDLGVRPMVETVNPDGSTKWIIMQLNDLNGFAVVDFKTRKEIKRVIHPDVTPGKKALPSRGDVSHGMAITPDGKTLLVNSTPNAAVYAYSLPDLKLKATADLEGQGANWMTLTPDGTRAYVSNTFTNDVSVVDVASMKEVARVPVGFSPKRNGLWVLP